MHTPTHTFLDSLSNLLFFCTIGFIINGLFTKSLHSLTLGIGGHGDPLAATPHTMGVGHWILLPERGCPAAVLQDGPTMACPWPHGHAGPAYEGEYGVVFLGLEQPHFLGWGLEGVAAWPMDLAGLEVW